MHSRAISWVLLGGVMLLGTGGAPSTEGTAPSPAARVPTEGIREAREIQWAADLAVANSRPLEAYLYYWRVMSTFPGTPHGRHAKKRFKCMDAVLTRPALSPAEETPCTWAAEFWDFVTWP